MVKEEYKKKGERGPGASIRGFGRAVIALAPRLAMTVDIMPTRPDVTIHPDVAIHPPWVRVCHLINAIAIFAMIGSGWQVYNASPLFHSFQFSKHIALGEWLGGALLWDFGAMWVLVSNGLG